MSEKTTDGLDPVVQTVTAYRQQSIQAKQSRMDQNSENMDCFHMRQDFGHKTAGQSKEFLAKTSVAVEQFVSFLQQGLIDKGNWFSIQAEAGVLDENSPITSRDQFLLTKRQLEKSDFYTFVGDALKVGSLQSLMICKVHGKKIPKAKYRTKMDFSLKKGIHKKLLREEKMVWQLQLDLVRPEDYHPDPTGKGLYECQDIAIDLHDLIKIAEQNPEDYDLEMVKSLSESIDQEQRTRKSEETGQDTPTETAYRKEVQVTECWGTLVDSLGNILHENAVCAIANGRFLIRKPKENPLWHQSSPFVVSPILRVPFSVWHKAMMDAPTKHNHALNEIYNLMLDAGMQSVFGIRQIREHWLADPSQVSKGIPPGISLRVNASCPPGQKVLERVDTATEFSQAGNIFSITSQEFNSSAMTNDIRMGNLPERSTKATEIVSVNQSITGVMNGIVKVIEDTFVAKILDKSWLTGAQHLDDYNEDEVKALLGEEKALKLSNMAPEDIFAATAQGRKFKVFGLSTTMNKINDFRKLGMLMQTFGASPDMLAAFAQKYDMTKFIGEVIQSLDLDLEKLKRDDIPQTAGGPQQAPGLPTLDAAAAALQQGGAPDGGGTGEKNMQNVPNPRAVETGVEVPKAAMLQGLTTPGV